MMAKSVGVPGANSGVGPVGVPGTNSGVGRRVGGPKRVLNFCYACLKMQRLMLNLRVDVDSLVMEHIPVNKAPETWCRIYKAHGSINPAPPATL